MDTFENLYVLILGKSFISLICYYLKIMTGKQFIFKDHSRVLINKQANFKLHYSLITKSRNECNEGRFCSVGAKGQSPLDVPLWHRDYVRTEKDQGPNHSERNSDLPSNCLKGFRWRICSGKRAILTDNHITILPRGDRQGRI